MSQWVHFHLRDVYSVHTWLPVSEVTLPISQWVKLLHVAPARCGNVYAWFPISQWVKLLHVAPARHGNVHAWFPISQWVKLLHAAPARHGNVHAWFPKAQWDKTPTFNTSIS